VPREYRGAVRTQQPLFYLRHRCRTQGVQTEKAQTLTLSVILEVYCVTFGIALTALRFEGTFAGNSTEPQWFSLFALARFSPRDRYLVR
jgi:hypothetical protein